MASAASWLAEPLLRPRVVVEQLAHDVTHLRASTRLTRQLGLYASIYVVGDLLVDTGFFYVRQPLLGALADLRLSAVCCTHQHEDHSGNCGSVARQQGCPVYLRNAGAQWDEGVGELLPYRRVYWGPPAPYEPEEMPAIVGGRRRLTAVAIPGHSVTHTAFFEEDTGVVFTGDLFVSSGASAVMRHENPYQSMTSLRRVADLEPSLMLTGHGVAMDDPAPALRRKADHIERAVGRAVELDREGLPLGEVVRRTFPGVRKPGRLMTVITAGEFSLRCFVRAAIAHQPT